MLGVCHLFIGLLPGLPSGDENNLIQIKIGSHLTGSNQVPVVDGVKGSAHHPQTGSSRSSLGDAKVCLVIERCSVHRSPAK